MANLLKQLELDELSLVDRPANAQAMVSLFKRDNLNGEEMTEETEKSYETDKMECETCTADKVCADCTPDMEKSDEVEAEAVEEINPLAEEVERLKADNEGLRKALIEGGYVISADSIEKKAPAEFVEYDGESINKADIPAVILKALEAAEIAKADAELTKKAEAALPNFNVETAKQLVKSFETNEEVMGVLKAADIAFGATMEEVGKSDVDGEFTTAADKLDALVKSYLDINTLKKSDYAKAYAAVAKTDEGKALITKSYKGE